MSLEEPAPPDTLRFLLERLQQDQSLLEADRAFIDVILRSEDGSLTLRLQRLLGEAVVGPLLGATGTVGSSVPAALLAPTPDPWQSAQVVIVEDLLAVQEAAALLDFTLQQEETFQDSKIVPSGSVGDGRSDHRRRKSKVLADLGEQYAVVVDRIKAVLPWVFQRLRWPPFRVSQVEAQLTASNDGEFFKAHNDNAADELRSRELTFVYYFYREPKAFTGGELRLYDTYTDEGHDVAGESGETVTPRRNMIVFFPSRLVHEVLPISCPSGLFADSRFTVNGWLHNAQRRFGMSGGLPGRAGLRAVESVASEG